MPPTEQRRRTVNDGRVPPHNIEAEEAVLGAMLGYPAVARAVMATGLTAADFYKPTHKDIFDAIKPYVEIDYTHDVLLIGDDLRSDKLLEGVGGTEELMRLVNAVPSPGRAIRYAKIVADTSALRRVISTAADIADIAYGEPEDIIGAIAEAETMLLSVMDTMGPKENRFEKLVLVGDQITTIPRPEPLIDGMLFRRSLSVIFGKPGAAKSFLALDWSASIASGSWWMGHRVHQGRVLYVIAEGAEGMGDRFNAWRTARNIRNLDGLHWLPTTVNLFNPADVADLISYATGRGYEMIVVDTLARCSVGADEVSGKDIGVIIDALERLRLASGAAIMLVHHTPKDGETMRGHTALEGAVDTTIKVGQTEGIIKVENPKQKNAAKFDPMMLTLCQFDDSAALVLGSTRIDPDGDRSISRMVEMLRILDELDSGHGVSKGDWFKSGAAELGVEKSTLQKLLKPLKDRLYVEQFADNQRSPWKLTDLGKDTLSTSAQVGIGNS